MHLLWYTYICMYVLYLSTTLNIPYFHLISEAKLGLWMADHQVIRTPSRDQGSLITEQLHPHFAHSLLNLMYCVLS